jgi:hypothetical protein
MHIYVSGPISGYPERNAPAFVRSARILRARGHEVVIPHEIDAVHVRGQEQCASGYDQADGHTSACFLRGDLLYLLQHCDAAYFLRGWEWSRGARLEHVVAAECGLELFYEPRYDRAPCIASLKDPGSFAVSGGLADDGEGVDE